jgi:hypothetical protein
MGKVRLSGLMSRKTKKLLKFCGDHYMQDVDDCGEPYWFRTKSLNRLCVEQRNMQIWQSNLNCHGRRFGKTPR